MAKKAAVKKKAVKKPAVKKAPVKAKVAKEISVFEQKVLDQVQVLFKEGLTVILECEGRNITIKKSSDVVELVRTFGALNLYGMKSGCAARTVQIR